MLTPDEERNNIPTPKQIIERSKPLLQQDVDTWVKIINDELHKAKGYQLQDLNVTVCGQSLNKISPVIVNKLKDLYLSKGWVIILHTSNEYDHYFTLQPDPHRDRAKQC